MRGRSPLPCHIGPPDQWIAGPIMMPPEESPARNPKRSAMASALSDPRQRSVSWGMTNAKNDKRAATDDSGFPEPQVSEMLPHAFYDPLLFDWQVIAAIAWEGYLPAGAGHVAIVADGEVSFEYRPGAPCECHGAVVGEYDPEQQVVVALHFEGGTQVHCLVGWPLPPEAYATVDAGMLGAVVH